MEPSIQKDQKCIIVYDSVFGNTEKIALAISGVLNSVVQTEAIPVSKVLLDNLYGVKLLVIGSPTRSFRPTEAITRFLKSLSKEQVQDLNAAAFDTRIDLRTIESGALRFIVSKGGYAARTIAKELTSKGARLVVPGEGFLVSGEQGPLKEGELERAAEWARNICAHWK